MISQLEAVIALAAKFNVDVLGWAILAGALAAIVVALAYRVKGFTTIPDSKPTIALLPKYIVTVPIETTDAETSLTSKLISCGFRQAKRTESEIQFSRGSALGEFSIKIAKLVVTSKVPVENPVQLRVRYGVLLGCAFDTGDLWKFCQELSDKMEVMEDPDGPDPMETGNPYQAPWN